MVSRMSLLRSRLPTVSPCLRPEDRWRPTKSKQLQPLSHVDIRALLCLHSLYESEHRCIDVRLKIFQSLHCIDTADQPALRSMNCHILLSEQIELAATLKHVVPLGFAELGAGPCDLCVS